MNGFKYLIGCTLVVVLFITSTSCTYKPEKAEPVSNFQIERYLGTWFEIARLDHSFEEGLSHVTATYTLNEDGTIAVLNKGYDKEKMKWKSADGKAKFREDQSVAALKVSFFGPFYSGYNVLALDKDYQYALVAGKDFDYLWILSRTTDVPENIKTKYLELAKKVGYDTDKLLWVDQEEKTKGNNEG